MLESQDFAMGKLDKTFLYTATRDDILTNSLPENIDDDTMKAAMAYTNQE